MSKLGEALIRAMGEALVHAKGEGSEIREESKARKRDEREDDELNALADARQGSREIRVSLDDL